MARAVLARAIEGWLRVGDASRLLLLAMVAGRAGHCQGVAQLALRHTRRQLDHRARREARGVPRVLAGEVRVAGQLQRLRALQVAPVGCRGSPNVLAVMDQRQVFIADEPSWHEPRARHQLLLEELVVDRHEARRTLGML